MVALAAAFQFLTTLPAIIRRPFTARELGRSTAFYPIVGFALGLLVFTLEAGTRALCSPAVGAAVAILFWFMFTRALHFDGFLDTCDGLFGGFTPERRLEIMRDSRVGAFGVAGGGVLLLLKYSAIITLSNHAAGFILATTIARWGMVMAIVFFPYARPTGLGRTMKDQARWPQALVATIFTALVVPVFGGLSGILVWIIGSIILLVAIGYVLRLIPGLTGDIYGALCEIIEVIVLIAFTIS